MRYLSQIVSDFLCNDTETSAFYEYFALAVIGILIIAFQSYKIFLSARSPAKSKIIEEMKYLFFKLRKAPI
jgi:hypothetical protein